MCRGCKDYFRPKDDDPDKITYCSPECLQTIISKSLAWSRGKATKQRERDHNREKRENMAARRRLNEDSLPHQKYLTQKAFNRLIVLLDQDKNYCASCGRSKCGSYWDCGHVKSIGSHPELRFDFLNAYKQGSACNRQQRLSSRGLVVSKQYEERLPVKTVEYLNGHHQAKHYTREGLKEMRAEFTKEIRLIESGEPPSRNWR